MSKVVIAFVLLDDADPSLVDDTGQDLPLSTMLGPEQFVEALKDVDPNYLDEVQTKLYDFLWGPGGPLFEEWR